jgi:hypothetical protein
MAKAISKRKILLIVLAATAFVRPALTGASDRTQDVRAFVQSFYDSYVKLSSGEHKLSPSEVVLAKRASVLSPQLFQALKADDDAQRKVPDDVVGLDFDPFLNSQEEASPCTVGKITLSHGIYMVEVRSKGSTGKEPDVIAEVGQQGSNLVFVNLLYPGQGDLLGILKTLAKQREQPSSHTH